MNIHEYQAKTILSEFNVPIPKWLLAQTSDEAGQCFEQLAVPTAVIKAQVHAGGRGKGGGVKLVHSQEEAKSTAHAILSKPLITPQTGALGVPVKKVMITLGIEIAHEYYLGITLDRNQACPVLIASAEGGIEIEEVARNHPEKIIRESIDPDLGLYDFQARHVAFQLGFQGDSVPIVCNILQGIASAYLKYDCFLLEINPLVQTKAGEVLALDAKMSFDPHAYFRHQAMYSALQDDTETPSTEVRAKQANISYISLEGNIGCMVNGAGLAMATMDIIKYAGGYPANFLDVGGGAKKNQVIEAFQIILSDTRVKGILVNIFGGIVHCDVIAQGIMEAVQAIELKLPLVVRLEGTHSQEGKAILEHSHLKIITAATMQEAAEKIVSAVQHN